jgi:hypothetical protein
MILNWNLYTSYTYYVLAVKYRLAYNNHHHYFRTAFIATFVYSIYDSIEAAIKK